MQTVVAELWEEEPLRSQASQPPGQRPQQSHGDCHPQNVLQPEMSLRKEYPAQGNCQVTEDCQANRTNGPGNRPANIEIKDENLVTQNRVAQGQGQQQQRE